MEVSKDTGLGGVAAGPSYLPGGRRKGTTTLPAEAEVNLGTALVPPDTARLAALWAGPGTQRTGSCGRWLCTCIEGDRGQHSSKQQLTTKSLVPCHDSSIIGGKSTQFYRFTHASAIP
jgi:hypothetical protein